jgi:PAS domain S-box-containing protein
VIQLASPIQQGTQKPQEGLPLGLAGGVIASATDAIISIDSRQRVVLFNPAAEKMFQVSAQEALGQSVDRFIPKRFREAHKKHVGEFGRTGGIGRQMGFPRAVMGLGADGQEFLAEASISHVQVGGDRFYTAILRDVSERRRSEETLRETGQRLSLAVETARLGTYERDLVNNEVLLNDACREILGLPAGVPPPPDIAHRSAHPDDAQRVMAAVARSFDPVAREVCAAEFRILRPDGTVRWVAGRGRVVFDDTVTPASPQKFLGVLLDITERKHVEEELLHAKQLLTGSIGELERQVQDRTSRLQEMVAELEHMSYTMVHDMRAPLRAIQSFGEILQQDPQIRLSEKAYQMVAKMQTASHRMDQLLTGALNYNEAVRKSMPVGPANVLQVLQDVLAGQPDFQLPHAQVTLQGEFPWVKGNEAGLAQCFAELIRNAVKFVEPGKRPRVRVWAKLVKSPQAGKPRRRTPKAQVASGDALPAGVKWVRVCFADNGTGIPEAWMGRIFDLFQRSHGSEFPGTGVGLALVRKIIEHMGGHIGVQSVEGKGSLFWLELPRSA